MKSISINKLKKILFENFENDYSDEKYVAEQIPSEFQGDYIDLDYISNMYGDIVIYGNHRYLELNADDFNYIKSGDFANDIIYWIKDSYYEYCDDNDIEYNIYVDEEIDMFKTLPDDYFKNALKNHGKPLDSLVDESNIDDLRKLLGSYIFENLEDYAVDVYSVYTGIDYEQYTLRGVGQSDWVYALLPASGGIELKREVEAYYFNTGSEWILDDVTYYIPTAHGDEEIKQKLSDMSGIDVKNIVLEPAE